MFKAKEHKGVKLRWRASYRWAFHRERHIRLQLETQLELARKEKDDLEQVVKQYRAQIKAGKPPMIQVNDG